MDWIKHRSHSWTRVGTLDGVNEAVVDTTGMVSPVAGRPSIDWWLSAGKGWTFPSEAPTVRQTLVSGTPVVETRVRVPSGDAIHRVYGIRLPSAQGGGEAIVIEVSNEGHVPFGLALAVRPFDVDGPIAVNRVALDGARVLADGRPVVLLPRSPERAIAGVGADGDLGEAVSSNAAVDATFAPLDCPDGQAQAAVVVAISHGTTFRAVIPLPDDSGNLDTSLEYPVAVPTSDQVVEGWKTHARELATVDVPDARLQAVLDSARTMLMIAPFGRLACAGVTTRAPQAPPRWDHVAAVARACTELGLADQATDLLVKAFAELTNDGIAASAVDDPFDPARLLIAAGDRLACSADADLAAALVQGCADILDFTGRRRGRWGRRDLIDGRLEAATLRAAGTIFTQAGETRAAADATRAAQKVATTSAKETGDPITSGAATDVVRRATAARAQVLAGDAASGWRTLDTLLDAASATASWPATLLIDPDQPVAGDRHSLPATAAVASLAFALLARSDGVQLSLFDHVPKAWRGEGMEVHHLVSPAGQVSAAVRWHDDRPALLWEVEPLDGKDLSVCALGLDPNWQGSGRQGDALLAPVELPERVESAGVVIGGLSIGAKPGGPRP